MERGWAVFLFCYLCPVLQLGAGIWMKLRPPRFQNGGYGYYTARSASSPDLWDFAQQSYAAKNLRFGFILLAAVSALHFFLPVDAAVSNCAGLALGLASTIYPFVAVEKELKKLLKIRASGGTN